MTVSGKLFALRDEDYKKFNASLIPTVNPDTVIGVRTPALRKMAKEISGTADGEKLMKTLPHKYYEENNLHGMLIERIVDFDKCIKELERFLPFVDNWATCDLLRPKVFKKHPEKLLIKIKEWISSEHTYTVRFGMGMLMCHFLDENFREEYLSLVASVESDEYYIKMMQAWFFATALAKQWDTAVKYIEKEKLSPWVHNKTIQKARESFRITKEQKEYLLPLKK